MVRKVPAKRLRLGDVWDVVWLVIGFAGLVYLLTWGVI